MKDEFFPLGVVVGIPRGSGVRFLHPDAQLDVKNHGEAIWAILEESNGYQDVETVLARAAKKVPVSDVQVLRTILDDLRALGIISDSRQAFAHAHSLGNNPMSYWHSFGFEEIREYTDTPRMTVHDGTIVSLDQEDPLLSGLLGQRRSCRSFADKALSLRQIGQILRAGYSISDHTVPSAGGLYPLRVFLIILKSLAGFDPGYYEFNPETQNLILFNRNVDYELLEYAFDSESLVFNAPVVVVLAADAWRHSKKYSNRGYRYTLLEAGHVAQNMHLSAVEAGLESLEYGGFLDAVLAEELGLDVANVWPVISVAVGHPSAVAVHDWAADFEKLVDDLVGPGRPIRHVRITKGASPGTGETFFEAQALYKPGPEQDARRSYSRRFASGAGSSAIVAQYKALCEGYERYASSLVRVDQKARASELEQPWLDPFQVAPLSEQQLAHLGLRVFDASLEWEWVRGRRADGSPVLVPVDLVFYPLREQTFQRKLCYEANSSGAAAHSNENAAIGSALLELIERDRLVRNWFERRPPARIAAELLPYHWQRRVRYWNDEGYRIHVVDHSAYGVAVASVIVTSERTYPSFVCGAAASIESFWMAAAKAFQEAELGLLHARANQKMRPITPEDVFDPAGHARLYAYPKYLPHLLWLEEGPDLETVPVPSASIPSLLSKFDVVVIPLTPPEGPLAVVRVISEALVPMNFGQGSEHFLHPAVQGLELPPQGLPHYFA